MNPEGAKFSKIKKKQEVELRENVQLILEELHEKI